MKWPNLTKSQNSVIRQSILLLFIVVPAYFVNFLFLIVSQRILGLHEFGIFYTAVTLVNILVGPAVILNLFFSRRITIGLSLHGLEGAIWEFRLFVQYVLRRGSIVGLIVLIIMGALGYYLRVESTILVLLICVTAYGIYLAETTRAAFQGVKRFIALGIVTLSWMVLRFVFGILGLVIVGSAWAGLFGICLAALAVFFSIYYIIAKPSQNRLLAVPDRDAQELKRIVFFCSSYGLFIVLMYLDIITAYIGLSRPELGMYSGACILGKSIILITNPIAQVFFPIMVEQNTNKGIEAVAVFKTFAITLLISSLPVSVILVFADFIGSAILGLGKYNVSLIRAVAMSAIPLCLLRILVLLQLSRGFDKHALFLFPICLLQIIVLYSYRNNVVQFAWAFTVSCFVILFYYGILCIPKHKLNNPFAQALSKQVNGSHIRRK